MTGMAFGAPEYPFHGVEDLHEAHRLNMMTIDDLIPNIGLPSPLSA